MPAPTHNDCTTAGPIVAWSVPATPASAIAWDTAWLAGTPALTRRARASGTLFASSRTTLSLAARGVARARPCPGRPGASPAHPGRRWDRSRLRAFLALGAVVTGLLATDRRDHDCARGKHAGGRSGRRRVLCVDLHLFPLLV